MEPATEDLRTQSHCSWFVVVVLLSLKRACKAETISTSHQDDLSPCGDKSKQHDLSKEANCVLLHVRCCCCGDVTRALPGWHPGLRQSFAAYDFAGDDTNIVALGEKPLHCCRAKLVTTPHPRSCVPPLSQVGCPACTNVVGEQT